MSGETKHCTLLMPKREEPYNSRVDGQKLQALEMAKGPLTPNLMLLLSTLKTVQQSAQYCSNDSDPLQPVLPTLRKEVFSLTQKVAFFFHGFCSPNPQQYFKHKDKYVSITDLFPAVEYRPQCSKFYTTATVSTIVKNELQRQKIL